MGKYCCGCCKCCCECCKSPPPTPGPDPAPAPAPAATARAPPPPPRLFGHIKDATQLTPLIYYVEQELSRIGTSGQHMQPRSEGHDLVNSSIEDGSKLMENISKEGEALQNGNFGAGLPAEMKTMISRTLEAVGQAHWICLGFSVIAFVLHRIDQVSSNKEKCVQLLVKMLDLAKRLQLLHERMPNDVKNLSDAVQVIVEGVITCCCCMAHGTFFKYLFASTDAERIESIEKAINSLMWELIFMIDMDNQGQIPRRHYPSEYKAPVGTVGIDEKIEEVKRLLDMEGKGQARAVILYGLGGVGKTTLAKCVLSQLNLNLRGFQQCTIGFDEKSPDYQEQLYEALTKRDRTKQRLIFNNYDEGKEKLKEVLEKEPASIFIFIDNVRTEDQIRNFLPDNLSLPTSTRLRLLVTSRERETGIQKIQIGGRVVDCKTFLVKGLEYETAKEYFRQKVLQGENAKLAVISQRISLSKIDDVAKECSGIPLLLKVCAHFLATHGDRPQIYDDIVNSLQGGEPDIGESNVGETLMYVYHRLDQRRKDAFVDICTYFHGWERDEVGIIVGRLELNTLEYGALVTIDASNRVIVHDILRAMGIKEGKGNETRIKNIQEFSKALSKRKEVNKIEVKGLWLLDGEPSEQSLNLEAVDDSLRVLAVGSQIRLTGECNLSLFTKLTFLQIQYQPCLSDFNAKLPENLKYIKMSQCRRFRTSVLSQSMWENIKGLKNLEKLAFQGFLFGRFPKEFRLPESLIELDLSGCRHLQELPRNLGSLIHLNKLTIDYCAKLKSLPADFYKWCSLECLRMKECKGLEALPAKIQQPFSLQSLDLSMCSQLKTLPANFGCLSSLESLDLSGLCDLEKLPETFGKLSNLSKLIMHSCKSLESLSESFCALHSLQLLNLSWCEKLNSLPNGFGNLKNLQSLYLVGCDSLRSFPDGFGELNSLHSVDLRQSCNLTTLSNEFGKLASLQLLNLEECRNLTSLPHRFGDLKSLQSLFLSGCGSLKSLGDEFVSLTALQTLHLNECRSLTQLPDKFDNLTSLRKLDLGGCEQLTSLPNQFGNLKALQTLHLSNCKNLCSLPNEFGNLSSLQLLNLNECQSLTNLPDGFGNLTSLQELDLGGCEKLSSLSSQFGNLMALQTLHLSKCKNLSSLPNEFGNLSSLQLLNLNECQSLTNLPSGFGQLKRLQMSGCSELATLPGDFQCLKYLDVSSCSKLEGNMMMERLVKLDSLQFLNISNTKLAKQWNEMDSYTTELAMQERKLPLVVKTAEGDDSWQYFMKVAGVVLFQNRCLLVDRTGKSMYSADFIQAGTTLAFLFARKVLDEDSMEDWVGSKTWQVIYIQTNKDCSKENIIQALELLPDRSCAIACSENELRSFFDIVFDHCGHCGSRRGTRHACLVDVNMAGISKCCVYQKSSTWHF